MESALYLGTVRHRRHAPRRHRFSYPLFMLYADLDELDAIERTSALLSVRGPALAWLRRGDYFGAAPADAGGNGDLRGAGADGNTTPESSWSDAVRRLVEAR